MNELLYLCFSFMFYLFIYLLGCRCGGFSVNSGKSLTKLMQSHSSFIQFMSDPRS